MTQGIYCYIDKKDNSIVYIGKDSYINRSMRHKGHYRKSLYDNQPINRILQNNLDRYKYKVIKEGKFSEKELNDLEISYISKYNPIFNFTKGGDGALGYRHSEEYRKWFSENNPMKDPKQKERMRKNNPMKNKDIVKKMLETKRMKGYFDSENNGMFGKHHSEETKKKIGLANKNKIWSNEEKIRVSLGVSKAKNTSGYYRVCREKSKKVKQGFVWVYSYVNKNGVRKKMSSINIKKLEQKVKKKKLPWFKIGEVK